MMKNQSSFYKEDHSPKIPQREKFKGTFTIKENFNLTDKQKQIIERGLDSNLRCLMIDGIWGTSKSYLATLISLKLLFSKKVDQILFVRNPVESSSTGKLGYLKGSLEDKLAPYNEIFFNKIDELLSKPDIEKLNNDGRLACLPLGFTRGLSWNCKAVIVDECASMTYDDFLLLLSRCGPFTRIFFIGDSLNQNDIGSKSGFSTIFKLFTDEDSKQNGIYTFELKDETDIVRSGFVRFIMKKLGKINR
jgi:phosphate starvation-inducible protein PhoH and related proteins